MFFISRATFLDTVKERCFSYNYFSTSTRISFSQAGKELGLAIDSDKT